MSFTRDPKYLTLQDEVTPEAAFLDRRRLLTAAGFLGAGAIMGTAVAAPKAPPHKAATPAPAAKPAPAPAAPVAEAPAGPAPAPGTPLKYVGTAWKPSDPAASQDAILGYNNFYEFGTDKSDPARNSDKMTVSPWSVEIAGETDAPGRLGLTQLIDYSKLEERIYRHRCVEAWSMVIPWVGVPLARVIEKAKPKSTAKYVQFTSYLNLKEMPGARFPVLHWPYVEGLRLDEAMNPVALLAVGIYGKALQRQNGAPVRLVTPWKYGFKGAKSIVKITFTTTQPPTSWNEANPGEYGFYSNVNPQVDHPRWSQASERVLGAKGFNLRRQTEMFNGYEKEVAQLYAGMDMRKNY